MHFKSIINYFFMGILGVIGLVLFLLLLFIIIRAFAQVGFIILLIIGGFYLLYRLMLAFQGTDDINHWTTKHKVDSSDGVNYCILISPYNITQLQYEVYKKHNQIFHKQIFTDENEKYYSINYGKFNKVADNVISLNTIVNLYKTHGHIYIIQNSDSSVHKLNWKNFNNALNEFYACEKKYIYN